VLADRDVRAREAGQIRAELTAIHNVIERNQQGREERLSALIR
jgi:hypothetical protein